MTEFLVVCPRCARPAKPYKYSEDRIGYMGQNPEKNPKKPRCITCLGKKNTNAGKVVSGK